MRFFIADVFSTRRYTGNPLAVVLDAASLSERDMQLIAKEMNYSETAFVVGVEEGGARVRIFTPATEVPFAGHPVLGTAWVLQEVLKLPEELVLRVKAGDVRVHREGRLLWMRPPEPEAGERVERGEVMDALGVGEEELGSLPPQVVSSGISFLMVHLRRLETLSELGCSRRCEELLRRYGAALLLFCMEAREGGDATMRVFAPLHGVPEDPATGSGCACLGAYLRLHRALEAEELVVEQGHEVSRPSKLHLRVLPELQVGGEVVLSARGELLL